MRQGRELAAGVVLICGLVVFTGCRHHADSDEGSQPPTTPLNGPRWVPVSEASRAVETPVALQGVPVIEHVAEAALGDQTRLDGEQFALEASHLLMDARSSLSGKAAVAAVASPGLPKATAQYLAAELDGMRTLRLARHWDTTVEMWIRSEVRGRPDRPEGLAVEVAGISADEELRVWYRERLDVAWESDSWRLTAYYGGLHGPDSDQALTPAQQAEFLTGPGWRRIPPP